MTLELSRPLPFPSMACVRQEQVIYQLETAERALLLVRTLLAGEGAGALIQPSGVLKEIPLSQNSWETSGRQMAPEEAVRQIGQALQQLRATLLQS